MPHIFYIYVSYVFYYVSLTYKNFSLLFISFKYFLGLQASCSAVFAQLAVASCPLTEDALFPFSSKSEGRQHLKRSLLSGRGRSLRLHESHILSMDVILSRGLELGSHSPNCWKYVFQ